MLFSFFLFFCFQSLFIFTKPKNTTSHLGATDRWICSPLKTHNSASHFWIVTLGLRSHRWDRGSALELTVLAKRQNSSTPGKCTVWRCPPEGGHWCWSWAMSEREQAGHRRREWLAGRGEGRTGPREAGEGAWGHDPMRWGFFPYWGVSRTLSGSCCTGSWRHKSEDFA